MIMYRVANSKNKKISNVVVRNQPSFSGLLSDRPPMPNRYISDKMTFFEVRVNDHTIKYQWKTKKIV